MKASPDKGTRQDITRGCDPLSCSTSNCKGKVEFLRTHLFFSCLSILIPQGELGDCVEMEEFASPNLVSKLAVSIATAVCQTCTSLHKNSDTNSYWSFWQSLKPSFSVVVFRNKTGKAYYTGPKPPGYERPNYTPFSSRNRGKTAPLSPR